MTDLKTTSKFSWWPWNSDGKENPVVPAKYAITFRLKFENLIIGHLTLLDGEWSYEYAKDFKNQDEIAVLPDFPDKNKVYKSNQLYPFFIQRIPSQSQPKVKETLKKENIKSDNLVELLRRFGKVSISNPFQLMPLL